MSKVVAMDPTAELKWVPKVDRELPEKDQLKILYHPLNMREDAKLTDEQIKSIQKGKRSEYRYMLQQSDIKRMEMTIIGWENFVYPDGKKVPYSLENIAVIPPEIRKEYVEYITGRTREAEEDDDLGEAQTE